MSHLSRATGDTAKGAWRRGRRGGIVRVKRTATALAGLHFDKGHLGGRRQKSCRRPGDDSVTTVSHQGCDSKPHFTPVSAHLVSCPAPYPLLAFPNLANPLVSRASDQCGSGHGDVPEDCGRGDAPEGVKVVGNSEEQLVNRGHHPGRPLPAPASIAPRTPGDAQTHMRHRHPCVVARSASWKHHVSGLARKGETTRTLCSLPSFLWWFGRLHGNPQTSHDGSGRRDIGHPYGTVWAARLSTTTKA